MNCERPTLNRLIVEQMLHSFGKGYTIAHGLLSPPGTSKKTQQRSSPMTPSHSDHGAHYHC
jgi:hypothetical protein